MKFPKIENKKPKKSTKFDKFKENFVQYSPYIAAEISLPLCAMYGMGIPTVTRSFILMGLLVVPGVLIPYFVFRVVRYIMWG